jgi:uncharacterized protein with PIN domain
MTTKDKEAICRLSAAGLSHAKISDQLNIPKGTVKSFLYRNKEEVRCANCGGTLNLTPHKKPKKFCCANCRLVYWRKHHDEG